MGRLSNGGLGPDFVIIGAMRCGTTTLYRHLLQHPKIGMSRDKETDYFVSEKRDPDWYAGQFCSSKARLGEASPNYTKADVFPGVPARMQAECPEVRLIYVVRDPVARAVSQYRHCWAMGTIQLQPEVFANSAEYTHVINTSRYAFQLKAFQDAFDSERLLVIDFDDLVKSPEAAMAEICRHIGVQPQRLPQPGLHNDAAELSRIPVWALKFSQSPVGRLLNRWMGRSARDRARRLLAQGASRHPPPFPAHILNRIRDDLREDAQQFRDITGKPFRHWSV